MALSRTIRRKMIQEVLRKADAENLLVDNVDIEEVTAILLPKIQLSRLIDDVSPKYHKRDMVRVEIKTKGARAVRFHRKPGAVPIRTEDLV